MTTEQKVMVEETRHNDVTKYGQVGMERALKSSDLVDYYKARNVKSTNLGGL